MIDLFDNNGALFSPDRKHRYCLWRIWDKSKPLVMFIGLNPSTANESDNDPTIASVRRISINNGFGGFYMMNCWTFISTDPKKIKINPLETEWNNGLLLNTSKKCKEVVFAWGNFDIVYETERDKNLKEMFPKAKCLVKNKNGSPRHPLYCKSKTELLNFI